jgi:AcrR family transcriptional regulator
MTERGLRERKKQETRERITAAAIALFADRGFERVPVADIAAAAGVSTATVFNYFPTKEDLIYDGMESFHAALVDAIRSRPAGTSVVSAFRDYALQPRGVLADPGSPVADSLAQVGRIVRESPSLQARERLETDREAEALRALLADELGDDGLLPWTMAAALIGTTRGMARQVQAAAAEGRLSPRFTRKILAEATAVLDVVEAGLSQGLSAAP